jgi:hypothetical protein
MRTIFVWMLFLAFLGQSYVAQTHIHGAAARSLSIAQTHEIAGVLRHGNSRTPLKDKEASCSFCQAVLHAGAFVSPLSPTVLPPLQTVTVTELFPHAIPIGQFAAHSWHQRAPPLA